MYRFLVADDHNIVRKGLQQILHDAFPSAYIEGVKDAETAIKKTITDRWSLMICDMSMPGRSGLDVLEHTSANFPNLPVLILSMHPEDQYAIRSLRAGAAGYLSKEAATDELINAVHRVLLGRKYISYAIAEKMAAQLNGSVRKTSHESLSNREFDVFKKLAQGSSLSQISKELFLSVNTVSTYRTRILTKMELKNNSDITRYALSHNLI